MVRRIGAEYPASEETMGQSTIALESLISNLEFLNMNSYSNRTPQCRNLFAWYLFPGSYLLLKLVAVTLDSTQIDLKLFTRILAKIGYNLSPIEEPILLTLLLWLNQFSRRFSPSRYSGEKLLTHWLHLVSMFSFLQTNNIIYVYGYTYQYDYLYIYITYAYVQLHAYICLYAHRWELIDKVT